MEEIWELLDENGDKVGRSVPRSEMPKGFYHLGADVWIINSIKLVKKYETGNVWLDTYVVRQDINLEDVIMQETEVCEVKWATFEEIEDGRNHICNS